MGFSQSSSSIAISISAVLTTPPTGATPEGNYTLLFGPFPSGIAKGDLFRWNGSSASLIRTYATAGPSIALATGDTYSKCGGTWIPESVQVVAILTANPTAGNVAGLYCQSGGTPSGYSLGDVIYWSGSVATKYLSYSNAPSTITCNGTTYLKVGAQSWLAVEAYFVEMAALDYYTLPGNYAADVCRYKILVAQTGGAGAWFNPATYTFTPQRKGWYEIKASYNVSRGVVTYATTPPVEVPADAVLCLYKNGVETFTLAQGGAGIMELTRDIYCSVGDSIQIINKGGLPAGRTQNGVFSFFQARWISD